MAIPGVASRLEPDHRGFGTHQQLGLPECLFRQVFGLSCPQCGITTSISHLVRGQVGGAMRANPMGIVLVIIILWLVPMLLWSSLTGRLTDRLQGQILVRVGLIYLVMCVLLWVVRIPF